MNSFLKKFVIGEWNLGIYYHEFHIEFRKDKKRRSFTLKAIRKSYNCPDSFLHPL